MNRHIKILINSIKSFIFLMLKLKLANNKCNIFGYLLIVLN